MTLPPVDPRRLRILKALTALLETITEAAGYSHTLSPISATQRRVYRGRATFGHNDPLPCVSILEGMNPDREPAEGGSGMVRKDNWILLIQGWAEKVETDVHDIDAAHYLMADVCKCLGQIIDDGGEGEKGPHYMLDGEIDEFNVEPGVVRAPDETSERAYFYMRVTVGVAERLDDPYWAGE